ncbi:MAG: recombinase family protein [Solirubrobacterales bacterium]
MSDAKASDRPAAVLYGAKSTEDKKGSIGTQLKDVRAMADREGWEVVGEFHDEGFSAFSGNRGPGLKDAEAAAVESAQAGGGAVLVVQHSDRLARGAGFAPEAADNLAEVYSRLARQGVTIRTVQDDLFADSRTGAVMAALMGMRNSEDSARKSAAVRKGLARNAAKGKFQGARPLGYRKREGDLTIIETEAAIVRRMFDEREANTSTMEIARGLEDDGVRTARGKRWHPGSVRKILLNAVYLGHAGEVEDAHEPIIEREQWDRVQTLLAANARRPGKGRGRRPKGPHLFFGGVLKCAACGESMMPRNDNYVCAKNFRRGPGSCSMPNLERRWLDEEVFDKLQGRWLNIEATREQLRETQDRKLAEVRTALADAEAEVARASERLARVKRDYADGKLDADDWREFKKELTAERKAAEAQAERQRERVEEVETSDVADAEAEVLERLAEIREAIEGGKKGRDLDAVRAALMRLFREVVVSVPEDGRATLTPQRRTRTVEYDVTDPDNPTFATDPPSRVVLPLEKKSAETFLNIPVSLGIPIPPLRVELARKAGRGRLQNRRHGDHARHQEALDAEPGAASGDLRDAGAGPASAPRGRGGGAAGDRQPVPGQAPQSGVAKEAA